MVKSILAEPSAVLAVPPASTGPRLLQQRSGQYHFFPGNDSQNPNAHYQNYATSFYISLNGTNMRVSLPQPHVTQFQNNPVEERKATQDDREEPISIKVKITDLLTKKPIWLAHETYEIGPSQRELYQRRLNRALARGPCFLGDCPKNKERVLFCEPPEKLEFNWNV